MPLQHPETVATGLYSSCRDFRRSYGASSVAYTSMLAGQFRFSDSVVVVMRTDDGTIVDVNPAFERVLGVPRDEALGKLPLELDLWPDHTVRARIWGSLRTIQHLAAEPVVCQARGGAKLRGVLSCELFEDGGTMYVLSLLQQLVPADAPALDREDVQSYRMLFLEAAEGIYRSLPDGGFIDANPAMARIFGFQSPAELITATRERAASLYVDPGHAARVHEELDRVGRIDQVRSEVLRRDGSRIWVSENARAVRDAEGRIAFYEGTVVDITERLAAEQALRQSEQLYKILVDNCRDGVFLIQKGVVLFANRALADMLGYAIEELIGSQYMDLVAPEDKDVQSQRRAAREGGSTAQQRYELMLLRKDGTRFLMAVHADAIVYNGVIASTGVMRDVTEERRQQRALVEAEAKYRELFQNSPVGLFRTHPDGRVLEANAVLAQLMGYTSGERLKAEVRSMLDVYAEPAERARLLERLKTEDGFGAYRTQVLRRDGTAIWVEVAARVHRDERGQVLYFEGSVQDISARMTAEQALQRSEAKYRTLVDHAQVGVFISRDDRYVYVNHALAALLGYTEEELLQVPHRQLTAPDYLAAAEDRARLREQGLPAPNDYESCMLRKDGSRVYVTVSIGPVWLDNVRHMTGTVRDITKQRQTEQRLIFNAMHDALTGLPNRSTFQTRLGDVIKAARAEQRCDYAVLFLDLDGFKLVNDSLGHAAGDRLLVAMAEKLSVAMSGEGVVARYGGDEFTILPIGPCDQRRAIALADRILGLFDQSFDIGGQQVYSGASIGVVLGRPEYRTPDQVLRDADTAMYRAKAGGKSAYVIFDEQMHSAARVRFQLEIDLRRALERGEFRVYYQPLVLLETGAIVGFESLVRWQHPERGLLVPGEFLGVAEESGLIAEMDWWVLEETCRQLVAWRRRFPAHRDLRANVNVDERQIADPHIVREVRGILDAAGVDPSAINLEVTETVFRLGRGHAIETLASLKSLGVALVVDDFGTGYSSLDSFAASPFDALKVDRSFVHDMETNRRHRAIVRTITGFADDLGLALTAEGVETEGQARLLRELGCSVGQGFLYSPPQPAERMEQLLGLDHGLIARAG